MEIESQNQGDDVSVKLTFDDGQVLEVIGKKGDKGDPGKSIVGPPGPEGKQGESIRGEDGKDGGPDTAQEIAGKLNTLEKSVDFKVLKNVPDFTPFEERLGSLEKSNTLASKGPIDQRWKGGGLSKVTTDSTLSGLGTSTSPLSVVSVTALGAVPIGGMIPWLKSFTGTPALPAQFLEANGQTVADATSPYNGTALPNLVTNNLFLRSNSTSGGTGGSLSSAHTHCITSTVSSISTGSTASISVVTSVSINTGSTQIIYNTPLYYDVVHIIRIK